MKKVLTIIFFFMFIISVGGCNSFKSVDENSPRPVFKPDTPIMRPPACIEGEGRDVDC